MALFDGLIADIADRYGLGVRADELLREMLQVVTAGPGGLAGFLEKLKTNGLSPEVSSWIGGNGVMAVSSQTVKSAFGDPVINRIAGHVGLDVAAVTAALGYALPKAISLLTPRGVVPQNLSTDVQRFLRPNQPLAARLEQARPLHVAVIPDSGTHLFRWGVPIAVLLGLAALLWHFASSGSMPAVSIPSAPVAGTTVQPRLWVSDDNGMLNYSGLVHDDSTRISILDALSGAFGARNITGCIAVDPNVAPAPWVSNLPAALSNLKVNGVQALFEGQSVNVGGFASDSDRQQMVGKLQGVLGDGTVVGTLADKETDLASGATRTAEAALAGLKPGYKASDLVGALNLSIINFSTGSAEIPAVSIALLQDAAGKIRELPAGTVIEISGYTDNFGDAAANVALSQRRADAVRNALIQAGVDPAMLVSKGYGQASPVSTSDTTEGRFRNRRIEYKATNS
jgi:OmpA-OmpF porin, OOP family